MDLNIVGRDELCEALLNEGELTEILDILDVTKDDILYNMWYKVEEKMEENSERLEDIVIDYYLTQGYDIEDLK